MTTTTTTARWWWTAMVVGTIASCITFVPVESYVPLLGAVSFRKGSATIFAKTTSTTFTRLGPLAVSTEESNNAAAASSSPSSSSPSSPPPPILNGKRIFPVQVLMTGLRGQEDRKIPAVYALLSQQYQRNSGSEGWDCVIHVGVSPDLATSIKSIMENCKKNVFHVRALSFSFPEPNAMQEIANQWKQTALAAQAKFQPDIYDASLHLFDDDDEDEDEDDDDDWDVEMTSQAMANVNTMVSMPVQPSSLRAADDKDDVIVSPFASSSNGDAVVESAAAKTTTTVAAASKKGSAASLEFTRDNVDVVLNEVRPYLISDGGNATVESVDESTKTIYLKLLGACGTCASSTVTMQMGIERVLRENFGSDVTVSQIIDTSGSGAPTELTFEAVQQEVQRLSTAIIAMGGVVRIVNVDPATGVVQLNFRGANKVQKGLELALLDVPFVNAVQFVMGEDEF